MSIKELEKLSAVNSRPVTVNVGLLKSALREINAHVAVNGKGIFTDMVLSGLNAAIERGKA
ncbi:UNVERIFIED_ORG: hypothetical protein J2Y78_003787 [Buttiauxella agrestis ATCC 33320]